MKLQDNGTRIKKIPINLIDIVTDGTADIADERADMAFTPKHKAIIDDMRVEGFRPAHPIEVRKVSGGRFQVVTGRQRFRCAVEAGLDHVLGLVTKEKGLAAMARVLQENELRVQDSTMRKARKIKRYFTALQEDHDATLDEVAEAMGVTTQTVRNMLDVLEKGIPALQKALDEEKIGPTLAYKIAPLAPDVQEQALQTILSLGLKGQAVKNAVQNARNGDTQQDGDEPTGLDAEAAALQKYYGKLGKKTLEHFMALTAELPADFRAGILFSMIGFQLVDSKDFEVKGLREAVAEFLQDD